MSSCDWCDEIGPDESRWQAERHEAHRAFHEFGRILWSEMVEPWAVPLTERLTRLTTRR